MQISRHRIAAALMDFSLISAALNLLFWLVFFSGIKIISSIGENEDERCAVFALLFQISIIIAVGYLGGMILTLKGSMPVQVVSKAIVFLGICGLVYWNFLASGFCAG